MGEVEVWNSDMSALYRTARKGDFFGEVALLSHEPSTCNCRAVAYVELWALSREDLSRLAQVHKNYVDPSIPKEKNDLGDGLDKCY